MSSSETSAQTFIDLLPPKQRQAIVSVFGEKFAKQFMGPIAFIDDAKLSSPTAINFFKRDFQFISKVLNYEYQYRSWNGFDQGLLDRYGEMITKKLDSINTLITNWNNRFGKLMESNGVKMESAVYSNAIETTVPIISGHARAYFNILKELDRLNLIAGSANLMGVITSTQRAEAEFMCKKAVRAFGAALRNEVVRLYREADRLIKEQHGHGQVDDSKAATIAAQGAELDAFGKTMDADSATDSGLNLGGADPSQVIADAAASTAAASKAAGVAPKARAAKKADAPTEA
jgi:hypothetical protein